MTSERRSIGFGAGLRTTHFTTLLERRSAIDWFEVISENFFVEGGRPHRVLERIRQDYPVVLHGVSLSIGSTDPLCLGYLDRLADLVRRYDPIWISDHLCWTSIDAHNLYDLLPLPWNKECLDHIVPRIDAVQERLGRRIALENVSSYLAFDHSTMSEAEFLTELANRADCEILLDVNNVYVSARNQGFEPEEFIDRLPAHRIVQIHLAGHTDCGTHLLDTHDAPVADPVWRLYEHAVRRLGAVPVSIEWDAKVPPLERLEAEVGIARRVAARALHGHLQDRAGSTAAA